MANVHEAQDLTQAFFCHLLEKQAICPGRSFARPFSRVSAGGAQELPCQRMGEGSGGETRRGANRRCRWTSTRANRATRSSHPTTLTPEKLYERRWVLTTAGSGAGATASGLAGRRQARTVRAAQKPALTGEATAADYERAAPSLGITPAAAKQAAYRMRKRYRQLFREEVARTVADETEVDDEIGRLLEALSG